MGLIPPPWSGVCVYVEDIGFGFVRCGFLISVTKILKKTENKTEMAKKGIKNNVNTHFFSQGGGETGKKWA